MTGERSSCMTVRQLVGLRESRGYRVWLILATVLGLIANFVVLLGCLSPATKSLYLYRVSRPSLALAIANTTTVKARDLDHPALPENWYWGLSGVCAEYSADRRTYCWHSFPPMFSLEDLITKSLDAHSKDVPLSQLQAQSIQQSWTRGVTQAKARVGNPSTYPTTEFKPSSRAAAALAMLSLFCGMALLGLTIASLIMPAKGADGTRSPKLWQLYIASIFDGLLLLSSGVISILARNESDAGSIILPYAQFLARHSDNTMDPARFTGPGITVLFAGTCLKFLAVGAVLFGLVVTLGVTLVCACACCVACCTGGSDDEYYRSRQPRWVYVINH